MRAALFLAPPPWASVTEQLELAALADNLGLDAVWADAEGRDGACLLGLLAARTRRIGLGCTDPAAARRAAATLAELAADRLRLEPLDRAGVVPVAIGEDPEHTRAAVAPWPSASAIATSPAGLDEALDAHARAGVGTLVAVPCGTDRRAVVRALAAATETR
jgi:hypothetical protein